MQEIHEVLKLIDGFIGGAQWFAYFLLLTGIFFTVYLRFPQIRYFRHAIDVVKGSASLACPDRVDYCVDGVSGATITSRGVDAMLEEALDDYQAYLKMIQSS